MAPFQQNNLLSETFLYGLYATCFKHECIMSMVLDNIEIQHLPEKKFQSLHKALKDYKRQNKTHPSIMIARQLAVKYRGCNEVLDVIEATKEEVSPEDANNLIGQYLRQVKFQEMYREAGVLFNNGDFEAAIKCLDKYYKWLSEFDLNTSEFVDVVNTFASRFMANKVRQTATDTKQPVVRFYIDELDARNNGRNLRGQLTCFLAPSGVGKSHIARWIGKNACQIDGLNVLHFQLEGSEAEVVDAYSASLVSCNSFLYETGALDEAEVAKMADELSQISGHLHVKSYPKFNANVSTVDIYNTIQTYKKRFGTSPDVIIIDSMDLLNDASGLYNSEKGERLKRIKVANDLKDLAADENVWIVVTYQSTIESQEWFNDEKNILTAYNTSEAKGLCRPLSHLITLNQSSREEKENTMRLHVAKSRFFKKCDPIRIATDYDNEVFYDRVRTLNLNKMIS